MVVLPPEIDESHTAVARVFGNNCVAFFVHDRFAPFLDQLPQCRCGAKIVYIQLFVSMHHLRCFFAELHADTSKDGRHKMC